MAYAVAILLISALTTVGLLALWAATSNAHWFWRTMGFLAGISPVLLIPAYEPFVAFVIQGAVVAGGVQFARWRATRKQGDAFFASQFSLRTVLLAMVPVAVLVAVGVRVPELNWYAWQSVVLIGMGGGAAALAAWWVACSRYSNWKVRGPLAALIVSGVSIPIVCCDYFILAMDASVGWPPDLAAMRFVGFFGTYADGDVVLIWMPILQAVLGLLVVFLIFAGWPPLGQIGKFRFTCGGILLFLIATPAITAYLFLMNPLPIPSVQIPNPNGYDDILAATKWLPANPLVNGANFDAETATEQELKQASDEISAVLNRVRQGLARPTMIELDYYCEDIPITNISDFRTIARGLYAQGRMLLKQDQPDKAADVFIDGARFGALLSRGGLIVDDLVGIACTGFGSDGLYASIQQVPVKQIQKLILALKRLETERDSWQDVVYRDKVWFQHALGWYGHLFSVMSDNFDSGWDSQEGYLSARNRELAVLRLLQLELALRLWQAEHGDWPNTVDELVPKYLTEIPLDPFSQDQGRLKSVARDGKLVIYSVGHNSTDEQGKVPDEAGIDPYSGDFRLDIHFRPEDNTISSAAALSSAHEDSASEKIDGEQEKH